MSVMRRAKPVHLAGGLGRVCDSEIPTKAPVTNDWAAVTCSRCLLTNAYKALHPPEPDWKLRGPMTEPSRPT